MHTILKENQYQISFGARGTGQEKMVKAKKEFCCIIIKIKTC